MSLTNNNTRTIKILSNPTKILSGTRFSEGLEHLCHNTLSWELLLWPFQWTINFIKYGLVCVYWSFKVVGHDCSPQRFILAAHLPLHSAFPVLFEKLKAEWKHTLNRDETRTKNYLTSLPEVMEEEYVVIIAIGTVRAKRQLRAPHTNTSFFHLINQHCATQSARATYATSKHVLHPHQTSEGS